MIGPTLRRRTFFGILCALAILLPACGREVGTPIDSIDFCCTTPPYGITAWWPFDGATTDIVGGNDPSATSAVSYQSAKVDKGVKLGQNGYIDIPHSSSLALQQFTIDAWVKPEGPGPNNDFWGSVIVQKGRLLPLGHTNVSVSLWWSAQQQKFIFGFGNSDTERIVSSSTFPANQFYFVAATYDGSKFKLFVNGVLEGQMVLTKTIVYDSVPWTIGSTADQTRSLNFPRTFNGVIDEVEIFNRALTQAEIQDIYNAGSAGKCKKKCVKPPAGMVAWWPLDETSGTTTANDLVGVPNNGTHQNGPTPTPGKVAGALRFDGVNDHVRVPDQAELNVGTGNFTIDAWVRTTSSGLVVLLDKRSGPTPKGYSLFLYNGRLGFQMANGVGSGGCTSTPTAGAACVNYSSATSPSVADGQWHHVAAVVDRADTTSGVRLYVDGVQVFTGVPMPPSDNLDNTSDLYMGVRTPDMGLSGFFPGDLDEVEIFKRALTQAEIQAIYNAGSAGKCKP